MREFKFLTKQEGPYDTRNIPELNSGRRLNGGNAFNQLAYPNVSGQYDIYVDFIWLCNDIDRREYRLDTYTGPIHHFTTTYRIRREGLLFVREPENMPEIPRIHSIEYSSGLDVPENNNWIFTNPHRMVSITYKVFTEYATL